MLGIFRYPGGKSKVRSKILNLAPDSYAEYREPFVGGGGVFFGTPAIPRWINDKHSGVVAVYKALRDRPDEFFAACRSIPCAIKRDPSSKIRSRKAYIADELWQSFNEFVVREDVDEALRYFVLQRCSMMGRVVYGDSHGTYFSNPAGWNVTQKDRLERAAEALHGVNITQGDFEPVFEEPGENVWIYADPPYVSDTLRSRGSKLYEHSFKMEDHERLAEVVRRCPHQVLLSYDDDDQGLVRSLYQGFDIAKESWLYGGATTANKKTGRELLIGNYDLRSPAILARIEEARRQAASRRPRTAA